MSRLGIAPAYGTIMGLAVAATQGWKWVAAYVVVAGPWIGVVRVRNERRTFPADSSLPETNAAETKAAA